MHRNLRTKFCIAAAAVLLCSAFAGGAAAKQTAALEDSSAHVNETLRPQSCEYDSDRQRIGEIDTDKTRIEALVSLSTQWAIGGCSKAWAYEVLLDAAGDVELLPTFDDSQRKFRRNMLELVAKRLSNLVLESSDAFGSYKVVLHSLANESIVSPEETFARERELREQIVEKTLSIVDSMGIDGEQRDSLLTSFAATWFGFGEASSDNMSQYITWSRPTFYSGGLSAWNAIQSSDNRYELLGEMGHYLASSDFTLDDMLLEVGLNHSLAALLADSGWRADQIVSGSEAVVSAFCSTMREREPELQRLYHYDQYAGGGMLSQDPASHPWWGQWGCERTVLLSAIVTHVAERGGSGMAENLILAAARSTESRADPRDLLVSLAETVDEGMGADEQIRWLELIYALHPGDERARRREFVRDVASARLSVGDTRTAAALASDVEMVDMDTAVGILADISAFYAEKCEIHHANAYVQAITDRIVRDPDSGEWGVEYAAEHSHRSWAYSWIARKQAMCGDVKAAVETIQKTGIRGVDADRAWYFVGQAYAEAGEFKKAQSAADRIGRVEWRTQLVNEIRRAREDAA